MGKKPAEIEREIAEKRTEISQRIDDLQTRMHDDIEAVRTDAKARSSRMMGDAKETLKVDNIKQMLDEHTLSTMAGAVGVGVLIGVVSEGLGSGGNGGSSRHDTRDNGHQKSGGGMSAMLATLMGPAASVAQRELQELVRDGFASLKGQPTQSGQDDKRVENRDVGVE